eukprot:CAMPEP_0197031898 /NCGR_PEP_ID=MMETSP1384-20130603/10730_1 /TAXON_ID=29189 /ORGANISM="Ammonia sp." /LENGTH=856 /DNA_ID=CAMNT_0042461477 /DNA_START=22 /DNA_END=2589 /DNA_ORIENTATION=+
MANKDVVIGDIVELKASEKKGSYKGKAECLFIGEIQGKDGIFYGVKVDRPWKGKHNGTYNKVKYFEAEQQRGIFVSADRIIKVLEKVKPRNKYEEKRVNINAHVDVPKLQCQGVVKFMGSVDDKPGTYYGVELNAPQGKNNGTVKGRYYFKCNKNYGIFLKIKEIEPLAGGQAFANNAMPPPPPNDDEKANAGPGLPPPAPGPGLPPVPSVNANNNSNKKKKAKQWPPVGGSGPAANANKNNQGKPPAKKAVPKKPPAFNPPNKKKKAAPKKKKQPQMPPPPQEDEYPGVPGAGPGAGPGADPGMEPGGEGEAGGSDDDGDDGNQANYGQGGGWSPGNEEPSGPQPVSIPQNYFQQQQQPQQQQMPPPPPNNNNNPLLQQQQQQQQQQQSQYMQAQFMQQQQMMGSAYGFPQNQFGMNQGQMGFPNQFQGQMGVGQMGMDPSLQAMADSNMQMMNALINDPASAVAAASGNPPDDNKNKEKEKPQRKRKLTLKKFSKKKDKEKEKSPEPAPSEPAAPPIAADNAPQKANAGAVGGEYYRIEGVLRLITDNDPRQIEYHINQMKAQNINDDNLRYLNTRDEMEKLRKIFPNERDGRRQRFIAWVRYDVQGYTPSYQDNSALSQKPEIKRKKSLFGKKAKEKKKEQDKEASGNDDEVIALNVSGQRYHTLKSTINNSGSGTLKKLLKLSAEDTKNWSQFDQQGNYFINGRNGRLFEPILNYLQSGKLMINRGEFAMDEIRKEFKFYDVSFPKDGLPDEFTFDYVAHQYYYDHEEKDLVFGASEFRIVGKKKDAQQTIAKAMSIAQWPADRITDIEQFASLKAEFEKLGYRMVKKTRFPREHKEDSDWCVVENYQKYVW